MILEFLLTMLADGVMRSVTATRRSFVDEVDGYFDQRRFPIHRADRRAVGASHPSRRTSRDHAVPADAWAPCRAGRATYRKTKVINAEAARVDIPAAVASRLRRFLPERAEPS